MRKRNWRLVISGFIFGVLALGFFLFMTTIASSSNDPAAFMQTVGQVAGVVGGISLVMIVFGLIGKKAQAGNHSSRVSKSKTGLRHCEGAMATEAISNVNRGLLTLTGTRRRE